MQIRPGGLFASGLGSMSLRIRGQPVEPSEEPRGSVLAADMARRMLGLRQNLDRLRASSGTRRTLSRSSRTGTPQATARSASPLTITTEGSPTTLGTQSLVSAPTTLNGLVKSFSGSSTSTATFDGTYDGSLGEQVELTFSVKKGGLLGQDDTEVDVFDDHGTRIDRLQIDKNDPGQVFTLAMGVNVSFSAGELVEPESFALSLSTLGGVLDPDQAFQGSGLPGGGTYDTGFELLSTATATLGGMYGGKFDDTLRFEVNRAGIVGVDDVELEVFDGGDQKIGTLKFDKELSPGTALSLSNGLTVALSSGVLLKNDQFEVPVTANDQVVFDGGQQVHAGTLYVNDVAIMVEDHDSIRTLADKITASAAGVTATFDTAAGEFLLSRKLDGPATIVLGSDSSGFFAATGLDQGVQVPGTTAGTRGVTHLSELPGLYSGTFTINGEVVAVDIDLDTIDDVINRINALSTDVQASFVGNRLVLESGEDLDLQNGSTGFFDAVEIATGLYEAKGSASIAHRDGFQDSAKLKQALYQVERSLEDVLTVGSVPGLDAYSQLLTEAVSDGLGGGEAQAGSFRLGLGLTFHLGSGTDPLDIDVRALDRALEASPRELFDVLVGRAGVAGGSGWIDSVADAVDQVLEQLIPQLNSRKDVGLLIDIRA